MSERRAARSVRGVLGAAAASAALLAALSSSPAAAGPGDDQFVTLVSHDPQYFLKAVRAGADFVKAGRGRKFRIILASAGVIVAIPGMSTVQRDYIKIRSSAVQVIACKESLDALSKANRRRVPVLPGISVQTCQGLRNKMTVSGWQTAPGFF